MGDFWSGTETIDRLCRPDRPCTDSGLSVPSASTLQRVAKVVASCVGFGIGREFVRLSNNWVEAERPAMSFACKVTLHSSVRMEQPSDRLEFLCRSCSSLACRWGAL